MAPTNSTTSPIWDHFTQAENGAKCRYCLKVFSFSKGTTSNLKRHLNLVHKTVPYARRQPTTSTAINIDDEAEPSGLNHLQSNQRANENVVIQKLEKVKDKLTTTKAIALTSDGWTNINNTSFMALTGHYIDENFKFQSTLLDCSEFEKIHSGLNIANWIADTINQFGITNKVVAMITDNASNMKAAVKELKLDHIPCFAHTLNLIVQHAVNNSVSVIEEVKK
uniref:BED-type domain-containing protein n=1 Tax=Anopheles epiroticus TaxID=199890 RepID=A0A182PX25_9DIPT